eukprot:CAMPEP_0201564008 /NCGR_PEP_ID=MMETSP0190_2-20130828/1734_1 /ASSEMBLY_ACC=CAM_ASM_000263 /TAXON_ID=37353 /ORGANISM="Rosalina sp." /LENGTH=391 /DNA_ID=CAMNT_0047979551 /DNA_START=215 /DNA_END=1387 /DNA_ORIENTATION=-
MAHDLNTLKSPASQTIMDVYSQSTYPSFNEFVNNTSLSDLRQNNIKLFEPFQQYQYYYNKDICSPLKPYLSAKQPSFDGDSNTILTQLSQIFDHCKRRAINMRQNCAQQMDVFFDLQSSQAHHIAAEEEAEDSDDDDEEDPQYAAQLDAYYQTVHSKHFNESKDSLSQKKPFKGHSLSDGLHNIMRDEFKPITKFEKFEPLYYSRHEMVIGGDAVKTLTVEDTTPPQLSPNNTPLFRHYYTVNSMKAMADTTTNLLCFSYHVLQSCIQLFCYILINGRIYGQRVFTKDLKEIVGSLYPNSKVRQSTIDEMNKNMVINSKELEFDDDRIYREYKLVLQLDKQQCIKDADEECKLVLKMSSVADVGKADEQKEIIKCKQDETKEEQNKDAFHY